MPIGCRNEDDCLSFTDGRWGRVVGVRVTHVAAGVWAGVLLAAAGLASGVAGEGRSGAMLTVLWNLLAAGVLIAALAGGVFEAGHATDTGPARIARMSLRRLRCPFGLPEWATQASQPQWAERGIHAGSV